MSDSGFKSLSPFFCGLTTWKSFSRLSTLEGNTQVNSKSRTILNCKRGRGRHYDSIQLKLQHSRTILAVQSVRPTKWQSQPELSTRLAIICINRRLVTTTLSVYRYTSWTLCGFTLPTLTILPLCIYLTLLLLAKTKMNFSWDFQRILKQFSSHTFSIYFSQYSQCCVLQLYCEFGKLLLLFAYQSLIDFIIGQLECKIRINWTGNIF